MVKRLVALVVALFWGGMVFANAGPAEQPPPDFFSRQYIDSTGCVFRRGDDGRWTARLNRDMTPVCGYPPTLSAPRMSSDGGGGLFVSPRSEPARAQQIEQALAGLVIPNLQSGELVGDRNSFSPRPDMGPEPSPRGPLRELRAEIAHQGQIRAQMNGSLQPNRSLCRLLGLETQKAGGAEVMPGADPSQGFCDSIPPNDLARLAFSRPANLPAPTGSADAPDPGTRIAATTTPRPVARGADSSAAPAASVDRAQATGRKAPAPNSGASSEKVTARGSGKDPAAGAAGPDPGRTGQEIPARRAQEADAPRISGIPAGTRFILIGTYRNGPEVDAILTRLSRMNMPIVRQVAPAPVQGSTQVILVGPFDSRQSIVRAFDRLRRAGLPAAPR